jgi:hypothetical protein
VNAARSRPAWAVLLAVADGGRLPRRKSVAPAPQLLKTGFSCDCTVAASLYTSRADMLLHPTPAHTGMKRAHMRVSFRESGNSAENFGTKSSSSRFLLISTRACQAKRFTRRRTPRFASSISCSLPLLVWLVASQWLFAVLTSGLACGPCEQRPREEEKKVDGDKGEKKERATEGAAPVGAMTAKVCSFTAAP